MNDAGECRGQGTGRIAVPGQNCWRTVRADRLAFLVDAAAYFRAFKAAALGARHSILIAGWDVNSRTQLEFPDDASPDVPNELGPLLDHLARRHDGLRINLLGWDSPLIYAPDREWVPQARFDWFTHPSLCFALDNQHPFGGSHHQKIAVVDDSIAFLGGIDLTIGRLDEPCHKPIDPRRRNPDGSTYEPYHDVQVAVSGPAAEALGTVARDRWKRATGRTLPPATASEDVWPESLPADLTNVEVSIARTYPAWKGRSETREVERLFLDSIACTKEFLYIENQYFTATSIGQALIERLSKPNCPEIVMVVPQEPTGWLEQTSMGIRQRCWFARLRDADRHGRFRAYMPMVGKAGETGVKVHAKIMVADDRFLRIGSANLNNRSMGLDSECDLALEGAPGSPTSETIRGFRDRLIAEHLDTSPERVSAEIEGRGSLIAAIEALRGPGRTLKPFPEIPPDEIDTAIAESELLDPAGTMTPERVADELTEDESEQTMLRKALIRLAVIVVGLLCLAALWRWGPLSQYADAAALEAWSEALRSEWTTAGAMLAAFVIGGQLMFPVLVLIIATGLILGPLEGLLVAACGSLLSAAIGYGVGALLGRKTLNRLSGGRLDRVSRQLARRGVLSVIVIRLLPLAPFTLVNMVAGASHISFRDFALGTTIGMAPGIVAITLFSGQLGEVMRAPDPVNVGLLVALALIILLVGIRSWRRFVHWRQGAVD
jgi:phospholipase D1/2